MSRTARKPRPWWPRAPLPATWIRWGHAGVVGDLVEGTPPSVPVCLRWSKDSHHSRANLVVLIPHDARPWMARVAELSPQRAGLLDVASRIAARLGGWPQVAWLHRMGGLPPVLAEAMTAHDQAVSAAMWEESP